MSGPDYTPSGSWWRNKVPIHLLSDLADEAPEQLAEPGDAARLIALAVAKTMQLCIPSADNNGGARRWKAGYLRWIALAWVCNPEMFQERTVRELAASLGVPRASLGDHVAHWQRVLAGEHAHWPGAETSSTTCASFDKSTTNDLRKLSSVKNARVLPSKTPSRGSAERARSFMRIEREGD